MKGHIQTQKQFLYKILELWEIIMMLIHEFPQAV